MKPSTISDGFFIFIGINLKSPFVVILNLVDMSDNTLNRLKDYLSGFWQYYQSSPSLQKALEIAG
ncbi:hypothetical protein EXS71_02715 [Candidatus Uhrbacteria bacterium]|nr:hypothetical protein [Candidatus Uhrbacteria bacterium]